jgi:hypothetical protein
MALPSNCGESGNRTAKRSSPIRAALRAIVTHSAQRIARDPGARGRRRPARDGGDVGVYAARFARAHARSGSAAAE